MTKRSISMPADLFAEVEAEARRSGRSVSEIVVEALRQQLIRYRGLQAVAEEYAESGEPTAQDREWALRALRDSGVIT